MSGVPVIRGEWTMMIEALCPVCDDRYILGTDDMKEPIKCFKCGCMFVVDEPSDDDGIILYEYRPDK
jgi:hypothetical protein